MRQVKDILSTVITNELSLNLKFKSVTTNADGHYVCECENTQYLNVGKTVVIDGVTYRVEAFTFNSSLTLSGASAPTAGLVYPIAKPTFVFGKYKDVHAQVAAMNIKDSMPMIWMFELLERSQPEDELSSIDSEGDVRLYFFNSMQNDWETSDHYTEVFDPLTNLIDAFVNACKASPLLGEIGRVARTNHAKFATGGQTISGGDERQIMPAYLSAIEVLIGIPVLYYCGALPDTACAPGNLFNPSGQLITQIPSGGSYTIDAGSGAVRNSDSSYENTVDVGETLVLPDIQVTDSDGSTSNFPSVKNVVCTPAADATVENSDESYTNTVASGGTLVLPDITVTDVDGSTRTVPSVQNVVCVVSPPEVLDEFHYVASDVVESGGAVSQMNDQSGNDNHAVQSNGALQPTLTTVDSNYNNEPTITCNQDYFTFTNSVSCLIRSGFYFLWVGNLPLDSSQADLLGRATDMVIQANVINTIWYRNDATLDGNVRNGFNFVSDLADPAVWVFASNGSTLSLYKDGNLKGSVAVTARGMFFDTLFYAGTLSRAVGTYAEIKLRNEYSLAKINADGAVMAAAYGFTWNTIT